jgi:hypothetical protein
MKHHAKVFPFDFNNYCRCVLFLICFEDSIYSFSNESEVSYSDLVNSTVTILLPSTITGLTPSGRKNKRIKPYITLSSYLVKMEQNAQC